MAIWKYKIELGRVMDEMSDKFDFSRLEEDCPQEVKEAIAVEISKAPPLARFAKKVKSVKSNAEMNRVLDSIYDVADDELVWTGGIY